MQDARLPTNTKIIATTIKVFFVFGFKIRPPKIYELNLNYLG